MTKNNTVDTAQKGQTTIDKTPTGKVKTLKTAEERRKAREEQYRNFRINALRRRCKRYGFDEEKTEEYVKKLIEQLNAPNEYTIIVMVKRNDMKSMEQSILNAKLKWTHRSPINEKKESDGYFAFAGNKELLDKIREIAPPDAKIHHYAKKMESVIPKEDKEVIKKPSNNTAEKKAAANPKRPMHKAVKSTRYFHRMQKGRYKNLREVFLAHKRSKKHKATTIQLNAKKSSMGSKKASTNLKKAA
jgi:hypothetical protein